MIALKFKNVDVIFGPDPDSAVEMLDKGADRDEIFNKTRNVVAVHNASLTVEKGQICVLMGLSGSGKSSLLRCVNGLNKVARGQVLIYQDEETDVASCKRPTLHRLRTEHISMVFQQFALMPWRTVRENVGLGLELSGISGEEREEIITKKLELVRLEEWADKYPNELSGGMQQRVGLARALATDADILLMDEPFSALDPLIREHLQDELLQLQNNLKKTILFVSHDLDEALKLGSLIAIMESGRIIQTGTPEEIVSNPVNDYVRQFVASMNPLKVLSCASLMTPVSDLPSPETENSARILDSDGRILCRLDSEGGVKSVTLDGTEVSLKKFSETLDLKNLPRNILVTADTETPMRAAVEVNHLTGMPMPVMDTTGRLLGVVGASEILSGILHDAQ
ncbi:ABC transporter ATP-binding protein [Desulfonema ishimotonii]|uniref:ABC transporter ATP-binding protein n=1 Tax=Desulfonema ishimotonii TaxID=45657 RepID=A0A401FQB9_9BACT|nr:choline ABC transporter ATP-binding protein [Desulfonema ishimotonii]GBC59184.1 ABC transporter ATP-binding protein [Desulfonema ishimotonii]